MLQTPATTKARKPKAKPPQPEPDEKDNNEINIADAFVFRFGHQWRYVAKWGTWFHWTGAVWLQDETLAVDHAFKRWVDHIDDDGGFCEKRRVFAIRDLAKSDPRIAATVEQWDAEPFILNTPGGLVDLRTGQTSPHDPARLCSKITAVAPKEMETPLWDAFLATIFADDKTLISYLYRVLGYCLTGDTREHAMFFGYGKGGNGKSVLIETISGIMGDYATTAGMETFIASHDDKHTTDVARLQGARLVVASETEEGRSWNESRIKSLTGGDRIVARFMRQDNFEFTPIFKLLAIGNNKPVIKTVDEAMRRRLNLIPFLVTIADEEKDKQLGQKLKAEWPGILWKAITGGIDWQTSGLEPPETVTKATAAYLADEDLMSQWLEECCEQNPFFTSTSGKLYASWKHFCEASGEFVKSQKWLSQKLESCGFERFRSKSSRGFKGLRVIGNENIEGDR